MFWEKSFKILPVSIVTGTMATASATYVVMSQPLERFITEVETSHEVEAAKHLIILT